MSSPPSVADSLRECTTASPRAWQAAVDAGVDDVEDEVVENIFFGLFKLRSQNISLRVVRDSVITRRHPLS
jgi:hypothetical protein